MKQCLSDSDNFINSNHIIVDFSSGNLKQKAIKQRMDFAKWDVLPSLEIEKTTKKRKKVNNENRKLKSQSVLLSHHEFSSSSSYNFNEISDNFSITKRTRKRRKSR